MTPSALTPAARKTTKRSQAAGSSSARTSGHRTGLRRQVSPRAPRRVSGPAGGAGAATVARPAVAPRPAAPRTAPSRPAPARRRRARSHSRAAVKAPWRIRSAAYLRGLPDHALVDRIIRGRAWIPILGVLLVGIVAMQVEVLKLNAGIGRSLERSSTLQSQNELLRAGVARLSDEQRIERIAAGMGMVMPAPDQMRFVHTGPAGVQSALTGIKAPDATTFVAQLPTIGAPAAAQGTSTNTGVGTAPTTATGAVGTATGAVGTATGAATGAVGTATGTAGTAATAATTATASGTPSTSAGASTPTQSTSSASTPATSAPTTSTPATSAPVTPTAPTTAGTTGQSTSSSTGGATPVGG